MKGIASLHIYSEVYVFEQFYHISRLFREIISVTLSERY